MKEWKIYLAFLCAFLVTGILIHNLYILQIQKGDLYRAYSQGLHINLDNNLKGRGEIFLEKNKPLAINVEENYIFINSRVVENLTETIDSLVEILNISKEEIENQIKKHPSHAILKNKLNNEEIEAIKSLNSYGVSVNNEKKRYYPQDELLSSVIGFLGAEQKGQYGLEEFYNEDLKVKTDGIENENGTDLFLTIDYNIQFKAETLLKKAEQNLNIKNGQIIVINPKSGEIKAMASLSGFNPNNYTDYSLSAFKNPSTQDLFEPGSVFKPITMAAGIEEGKITPETTYEDPGRLEIDDYPIYNYEHRVYQGETSMTKVLEKSINTGAVFAQQELGGDLFIEYLEKFGFFEKTGIDLPETYSINKEIKTKRDVNLATGAFGQGVVITPIQLIKSYCALANNGKLVTPHLVKQKIDNDNKISYPFQDPEEEQVISSETASKVTSMLISVVENGFGKAAKVPGYFIAGKTGTAQVSYGSLGIDKGGYSEETIQSFIGFAPAYNPQFLILVKLDNPSTKTAEYSAIPMFQELAEYIIRQYQIPFDYEEKN
jgi:cell division protein FtsI/penicillin-binding protein 2